MFICPPSLFETFCFSFTVLTNPSLYTRSFRFLCNKYFLGGQKPSEEKEANGKMILQLKLPAHRHGGKFPRSLACFHADFLKLTTPLLICILQYWTCISDRVLQLRVRFYSLFCALMQTERLFKDDARDEKGER